MIQSAANGTTPAQPQPPVIFEDHLGTRFEAVSPEGDPVEVLELKEQFASLPSFEFALRKRVNTLTAFKDPSFATARGVRLGGGLAVVSDRVRGSRLSTILVAFENDLAPVEFNAAVCILRQLVAAAAILHETMPGICHGAIAPERIVITPEGRVVIVEHMLASALEALHYTEQQYWEEFRIAVPKTAGPACFDQRSDVLQIGLVALSLIHGRSLNIEEHPVPAASLAERAWAATASGGLEPLPSLLRAWLTKTLQLEPKQAFGTASAVWAELKEALSPQNQPAEHRALKSALARYGFDSLSALPTPVRTPIPTAAPTPVRTPIPVPAAMAPTPASLPTRAPSHAAPSHAAPSHAAPSHSAPSHSAPSHLAPSHPAPSHLAPSHLAPSHPAPSHLAPPAAAQKPAAPKPAAQMVAPPEMIPDPTTVRTPLSVAAAVRTPAPATPVRTPVPAPAAPSTPAKPAGVPPAAAQADSGLAARTVRANVREAAARPSSTDPHPTPITRVNRNRPLSDVDESFAARAAANQPPAQPGSPKPRSGEGGTDKFAIQAGSPPRTLARWGAEEEPEEMRHNTPWWRRRAVAAVLFVGALAGAGVAGRSYLSPDASAAVPGKLVVNTDPPGIVVVLDGKRSGQTPVTLEVPAGEHVLTLMADGEPRTIPVSIAAGATVSQFVEVSRQVIAQTGQLQIRTEPLGARVVVDGTPRGNAPVTVTDLAPGPHTVEVANDVGSIRQDIVVEAGVTASLVVPMQTTPQGALSGWISVTAPVDVQIYEDTRLVGSNRSDRLMVSVGRHELDIVNEALGYRQRRTVNVMPGQVSAIRLDWPNGSMAINAQPWAEVFIDGERIGETPIGNVPVPIGTHEVVFRHPELGEQTVRATVTVGTPARLSVDLRKR